MKRRKRTKQISVQKQTSFQAIQHKLEVIEIILDRNLTKALELAVQDDK